MKKSIPLDVSSTLGTISTDTPIAATPYANATGVTTEKAPVLIAVRSTATVTAEEFATRMVKAGGQGTEAQARLALNAVAAVLGELVAEYGAITVNTPFGTVQTFIAGTLENAQDTPDPETNRAFLGVVVPEVYRRQFAQMTAYVPTDACPAALKRVRDKATNAKGICGTSPFYLEGRGMTIGGEGETLELLDAATRDKVCDIAVDAESKSPVQFRCTLSPQTAIEAGGYLLRLTTLAGGEAMLWPVELKVELVEAVPAPGPVSLAESEDGLIKIWTIEPTEGEKITLGKNTKVTGETLGYDDETGEGIMGVHLLFPGGITYDCGMDTIPPESTELILKPGEIPEGLEPGDYEVEMQFERVRDFAFAEMITVHNLPVTVEAQ